MGSDFFDLDLYAILIAYVFLTYGQIPASVFALGQGFGIDLFSGGLHGLFTSLYLIVFAGIYVGGLFFNLRESKGQFIIILLAVLLKKAVFLGLLDVFPMIVRVPVSSLGAFGASAVLSGLIAPLVFILLDRLKASFFLEGVSAGADEI